MLVGRNGDCQILLRPAKYMIEVAIARPARFAGAGSSQSHDLEEHSHGAQNPRSPVRSSIDDVRPTSDVVAIRPAA
jgi:hypothetical protein